MYHSFSLHPWYKHHSCTKHRNILTSIPCSFLIKSIWINTSLNFKITIIYFIESNLKSCSFVWNNKYHWYTPMIKKYSFLISYEIKIMNSQIIHRLWVNYNYCKINKMFMLKWFCNQPEWETDEKYSIIIPNNSVNFYYINEFY